MRYLFNAERSVPDNSGVDYHIVNALPVGLDSVDHEVWNGDELVFVINPQLDKCDQPCWTLAPGYDNNSISKALVQEIGEAIE